MSSSLITVLEIQISHHRESYLNSYIIPGLKETGKLKVLQANNCQGLMQLNKIMTRFDTVFGTSSH